MHNTQCLYMYDDATKATATVVAIDDTQGYAVYLDQTIFHPQGGGQKGDKGLIGSTNIQDTRRTENGIAHLSQEKPEFNVGDTVEISIDPEWRQMNARLHSAGHLIAAIGKTSFGVTPCAGHHFPNEGRVEFETMPEQPSDEIAKVLQEKLNSAITSNLKVAVADKEAETRTIAIGEYDAVPCGGTHVKGMSELGTVSIDSVKQKRGKMRVSYSVI